MACEKKNSKKVATAWGVSVVGGQTQHTYMQLSFELHVLPYWGSPHTDIQTNEPLLHMHTGHILHAVSVTDHGLPGTAHIAGTTVPRMFPTDVWEFQTPSSSPLLFLPNQFPITATTPGHPVDWTVQACTYVHIDSPHACMHSEIAKLSLIVSTMWSDIFCLSIVHDANPIRRLLLKGIVRGPGSGSCVTKLHYS